MSVVLIGYRGSGKTTVGRLLAARVGWAFVDSDAAVIAKAGKSIKDIFAAEGEHGFRRFESAAVAELATSPNTVIALGGGAVLAEANRQVLRESAWPIVYLAADVATLWQRISSDPASAVNRPNLSGGGIDEIRQLLTLREPIYRELASVTIDVSTVSPQAAAELIEDVLPPCQTSS